MKKYILIIALVSVLASCTANSIDSSSLGIKSSEELIKKLMTTSSTWTNELGSTLTINSIDSTGLMTGTYKSPSGTSGDTYPMTGWVNAASPKKGMNHVIVVSFAVNWGKTIGNVTTWNGTYDGNVIKAPWLLVKSNSLFSWDHTLTGFDTFTQQN